jgi:hypothetical protein
MQFISSLECSWPLILAGGTAYDPQIFRVLDAIHLRRH